VPGNRCGRWRGGRPSTAAAAEATDMAVSAVTVRNPLAHAHTLSLVQTVDEDVSEKLEAALRYRSIAR